MSRIVKSRAVVESRGYLPPIEMEQGIILKGRHVVHGMPKKPRIIPNADALTEELNRLRVEIKQAEDEHKDIIARLEEAREEAEEAQKQGIIRGQENQYYIEQAKRAADMAMADAEMRRSKIIKEAEEEGKQLAEQAKNEGYLEGFSKGFEEATEEFKQENTPKAVMIADILDGISEYQDMLMRTHEQDMIDLTLTLAGKILGRVLEKESDVALDMLRGMVEDNRREEYIKITLSPDLAQVKAKANKDVRALLENLGTNVTTAVDNEAGPGTVMVETAKGIVDMSVNTQLQNLEAAIRQEHAAAQAQPQPQSPDNQDTVVVHEERVAAPEQPQAPKAAGVAQPATSQEQAAEPKPRRVAREGDLTPPATSEIAQAPAPAPQAQREEQAAAPPKPRRVQKPEQPLQPAPQAAVREEETGTPPKPRRVTRKVKDELSETD